MIPMDKGSFFRSNTEQLLPFYDGVRQFGIVPHSC